MSVASVQTAEDLSAALNAKGFVGAVIPITHLGDLEAEFQQLIDGGCIDQGAYTRYMTNFAFHAPDALPGATSIILVAGPQPQQEITVHWHGVIFSVIVPPTYANFTQPNDPESLLTQLLAPSGYSILRARVPQKLLAAHAGLAQYGRNNITYYPDWGSFSKPITFFSDFPPSADPWQPIERAPQCDTCTACARACPTGAIVLDRDVIHADWCLTYNNENPAPLPGWIDSNWHHALVGCLRCQLACPMNVGVKSWRESVGDIEETETELLLTIPTKEALTPNLTRILETTGLIDDLDIVGRNLSVLLETLEARGRFL